jgi:L-ascorbate metabolism protein UlaG (beta-lactamase superfamily)
MQIKITLIGAATVLLEIGSLRLLTDPVFDPPGGHYSFGWGTGSTKLTAPAVATEDIGRIDAVLLSHDHHQDNLDRAGRAFLPRAGQVITTRSGAKRLGGNSLGLRDWESTGIKGADGLKIKVTATPARHGPWFLRPIFGDVIGFMLEWPGQQFGALYISGDTVWFEGVEQVASRFKVGTALLHIGGVRFPITGPLRFTFNGAEAARLSRALDAHTIIPIHHEGWAHFREKQTETEKIFSVSDLQPRTRWLQPGEAISIKV